MCYGNPEINEIIALTMQLTGALLIIISIDSNIGLLKNNTLWGLVTTWYRQRPWLKTEKKSVEASINVTVSGMEANARGHKTPETLEEKIEVMEKKLEWLNEDFTKNKKRTDKKLQNLESNINESINSQSKRIGQLKNTVIQSTIGGFKLQVFGVLLVFYSSILSYVT